MGERIFRDADDERNTKEISIEDTAYWFAENNGEQQLPVQDSVPTCGTLLSRGGGGVELTCRLA